MDSILLAIKSISSKYRVIKKVLLFGSRAKKTNMLTSDYDIAVFLDRPNEFDKLKFYNEIDEMDTLYKIDVTIINDKTSKSLIENINKDGIIIMENKSKIENYVIAVGRLKEAINQCKIDDNTLFRDGLIQRFEFCIELAWKASRWYMIELGFVDLNSPKQVMRQALSCGLIENGDVWINILNDRNLTSHMYNEDMATEIYNRILEKYIVCLEDLAKKLNNP